MIVVRVYADVKHCSNFMFNGLIPMQNFKTGSCWIRKNENYLKMLDLKKWK